MKRKRSRTRRAVKPRPQPPALAIPQILFEGDEPAPSPVPAPVEQQAPGPVPAPPASSEIPKPELPVAYGTGRLLLAARDPRCIYAHWDLTLDQLRHFNTLSAHHHLVLRVQQQLPFRLPAVEVPLAAETWYSFVPVEHAGAEYVVELGYHQPDGQWMAAVPQASVVTPPDAPAPLAPPIFATVALPSATPAAPPPVSATPPVATTVEPATAHANSNARRDNAELKAAFQIPGRPGQWTATQARSLAQLIHSFIVDRKQSGSIEISGLIQAPTEQGLPAVVTALGEAAPALLGGISKQAVSSLPASEKVEPRDFWLKVNAELVVYGATEPGAQLTIDGQPIQLRSDGTFTCRLAFPDGSYQLSVAARSSAGDSRGVLLQFRRGTTAYGQVGVAAPDPSLEPPKPGQTA